jgi:hypothetical protein
LPLGTFVRKENNEYLIDACIAYPSGEGMMREQLHSTESQLMPNAKKIANDFLAKGAREMIENLTDVERTEKTH